MSDHEFTIKTTEIDAGGKDYRFVVRAPWLRGVLEDGEATATSRDGVVEVRASKSGPDVVVHGTLDTSVKVPCARCLDPVDIPRQRVIQRPEEALDRIPEEPEQVGQRHIVGRR